MQQGLPPFDGGRGGVNIRERRGALTANLTANVTEVPLVLPRHFGLGLALYHMSDI